MVEFTAFPLNCSVTDRAILRETRSSVVRTSCLVEVCKMTGDTGGIEARELPVVMAVGALQRRMRAGQGEPGRRMIKPASLPLQGRMTDRAILREARGDVVRIGRLIEFREVTGSTRPTDARKLTFRVTVQALERRVSAGQGEFGRGAVVESPAFPLCRGMTKRAVLRKAGIHMTGVGGFRKIG